MNNIENILKSIDVPVKHLFYEGRADPYITYQFYNEYGEVFAEDKEIVTAYSVQVDIFTKGSFEDLYKQVMQLMTDTGWHRTYATEDYEPDTKLNHKIIRFQYAEEHS